VVGEPDVGGDLSSYSLRHDIGLYHAYADADVAASLGFSPLSGQVQ